VRIRRLPRAIRDVDEIWDWIAGRDMSAADRLTERVATATNRLADFPHSGTPRPDLGPGARSLAVGNYVVLYRVGKERVDILRVVHGARELAGLLGAEEEDL
jgi:toxin ParE1/3/4